MILGPMTFKEAANFPVPFGKYKGQLLDDVASTDEGLFFLDWLSNQEIKSPRFREALDVYLGDSDIAKEVAKAIK